MHTLWRSFEQPAAARQGEPFSARAARVEEELTPDGKGTGLMGVAEDHHLALVRETLQKPAALLRRLPLQATRLGPIAQSRLWSGQLVKHVDDDVSEPLRQGRRQPQLSRVDVSLHCLDGSDDAKLVEYGLRPNITGMQDCVYTLQQWG